MGNAAGQNIYFNLQFHSSAITKIMNGDWQTTKQYLRVTPFSFRELVRKLDIHERHGWRAEFKVMVFLFWLTCGTSFKVVCFGLSLPQTTVFDMCTTVLRHMMQLMNDIIRLPREHKDLQAIGAGFARISGSGAFSQCVGAIDCTQIRIICSKNRRDEDGIQKQFYSLNVQALVDHNGLFINMFSGFPGTVHDSHILRHSVIFSHALYPPTGYFIIGDNGYPCRLFPISLITPFKEPLNASKKSFNFALGKARAVVEHAFRCMKVRWCSIFTKALAVKMQKAAKVVIACAIIHNICVSQGDIITPEELPPLEPLQKRTAQDEKDGERHRQLTLALFLAERNEVFCTM